MDDTLFYSLLHQSESTTLDFKRDQYKFVGANKDEKSEIIKDILAFANSWRETDAYILIGISESQSNSNNTIVGIDNHLEDSDLQQLVTSNTNRPVDFSYIKYEYNGKKIGVIQIPIQKRPNYLIKGYGKLNKEEVYVRRGSSTDIANPDEIAQMGLSWMEKEQQIDLDLFFAENENRKIHGERLGVASIILKLPENTLIPDFSGNYRSPIDGINPLNSKNKDFYRELVKYFQTKMFFHNFSFMVKNSGSQIAKNPRLFIRIPKDETIRLAEPNSLPDRPAKDRTIFSIPYNEIPSFYKSSIILEEYPNYWEIEATFGDLQAKAECWLDDCLLIGSEKKQQLPIYANLYADNLPNPIKKELVIEFTPEIVTNSLQDIIKLNDLEITVIRDEIEKNQ